MSKKFGCIYKCLAGLSIGTVLGILSSVSYGSSLRCPEPRSIKDFVGCQNRLLASSTRPMLSDYVEAMAATASAACTRSAASAQPAFPDMGDLRCFLVFKTGATVSINLVENANENHIEVSQFVPASGTAEQGVLLAHFYLTSPMSLKTALESSDEDLNGRGFKCSLCHQGVKRDPLIIEGTTAWVLTPVHLNSTIRGTIPRNGQIAPELLDQVLKDLWKRHSCPNNGVNMTETCRRIAIIGNVKSKMPLDNPAH